MSGHIHLIDMSGLVHAAFYGSDERETGTGQPTNGINSWSWWLHNWLARNAGGSMSHIVAVADVGGKTFRHELFPDYKANRGPKPEELRRQMHPCRMATKAFGIPVIGLEGHEADDIIATLSKQAVEDGKAVTILSHDKDLAQLIQPGVNLVRPERKERPEKIIEHGDDEALGEIFKCGPLAVHHVVGLQALAGDSVDGIPGVKGIGAKRAYDLLQKFGYLDNIFVNLDQIPASAMKRNLEAGREAAEMSERLVRLNDEVDIEFSWNDFKAKEPDTDKLVGFLQKYDLTELLARVVSYHGLS